MRHQDDALTLTSSSTLTTRLRDVKAEELAVHIATASKEVRGIALSAAERLPALLGRTAARFLPGRARVPPIAGPTEFDDPSDRPDGHSKRSPRGPGASSGQARARPKRLLASAEGPRRRTGVRIPVRTPKRGERGTAANIPSIVRPGRPGWAGPQGEPVLGRTGGAWKDARQPGHYKYYKHLQLEAEVTSVAEVAGAVKRQFSIDVPRGLRLPSGTQRQRSRADPQTVQVRAQGPSDSCPGTVRGHAPQQGHCGVACSGLAIGHG
ncbi:hypothetical protein HPB47_024488 [Ixodes persulcatus]|uniref:Uncharacterized protein n=1 Tax=Ixodes persulcatus TaxID=34615 RepID=A0AC60Q480_IXOPE|nr:hypothetical protein HPB47_024488 [Ixodes persulcatus]